MSDIPDHLFVEILRRVPVESLFRFRSVCKTWRGIIDDPGFAKIHINRGLGESSLLIRSNGMLFLLPMNSLINDSCEYCGGNGCTECCVKLVGAPNLKTPVGASYFNEFSVTSCCNGMMLMTTHHQRLLIWNPFTSETLEVPSPLQDSAYCAYLYFSKRGLGYDEVNNDYKVVCAFDTNTFIYSVNSGVWCRNENLRFPSCDCNEKSGVFANGALHWVVNLKEGRGWGIESVCIVSLDLTMETYNVIDFPNEIAVMLGEVTPIEYFFGLVECSGCLFLTFQSSLRDSTVWKMDSSSAIKKIISLEKTNLRLKAFLESRHKALFCYKNYKFMWYDAMENFLQKVSMKVVNDEEDDSDGDEYLYGFSTFTYLVLPSSIARLKISGDGANQGAASTKKSENERKMANADKKLCLKLFYGSRKRL